MPCNEKTRLKKEGALRQNKNEKRIFNGMGFME
jgi:hypothetical protein